MRLATWLLLAHLAGMNALLDKAISAIRKLPEAEQEAIALELLERVEADARTPCSPIQGPKTP